MNMQAGGHSVSGWPPACIKVGLCLSVSGGLSPLLPEIGFEQTRFLTFEPADGFLLDLTHTLARKIEFGADFLKGHLLASDTEEHLQNFTLTLVKLTQRAVNLL